MQYGLGNIFFWRTLSIAGSIVGLLCVLTSLIVIESPRWLAGRVGMGAAESSLRALRQPHCTIEGTLREIQNNVEATAREREQTQLSTQSKLNVSWGSPRVVPIVLATILMCAVPLSGVLAVFSFAGDILEQIFPTYRNLASILIPVAGSVGVLCVTQGADRLGRKPVSGAPLYCDHVGKALCA